MIITTEEALDRYGCARSTLYNKRKRIEELGGFFAGEHRRIANHYKTSVLERMARDGEPGSEAKRRMLIKDNKERP